MKVSRTAPPSLLFILLLASFFLSYFFRVSSSVVLPRLSLEWGLTAAAVGLLSSLYFYAYAVMQPLSGALNDRFGPFRVAAAGNAISAVGALLMALAASPVQFGIGRLLTGLGLAPMLSGALVFQATAFESSRYALLSGITYATGHLGAVVSVGPLETVLESWGRSPAFLVLALVSLTLSAVLFALRRGDPANVGTGGRRRAPVRNQVRTAFLVLLRSSELRMTAIPWVVSFGALMAFQGLWAVAWYGATYGVAPATASAWATLIGVGVMAGSLVGGGIGGPARSRPRTIAGAYAVYALLWVLLWAVLTARLPLQLAATLGLLVGGAVGVLHVHLTARLRELSPAGQEGSLFGAMNMFAFASAIVFQWGTGAVLQGFPVGTVGSSGLHAESFVIAFGIVTAGVVAALLPALALVRADRRRANQRRPGAPYSL